MLRALKNLTEEDKSRDQILSFLTLKADHVHRER